MKKSILSFSFSLVFAYLFGFLLFFLAGILSRSDAILNTTLGAFILNIGNFLMFIVFPFGIPFGCITGTLLVDRIILKLSIYSTKRMLLSFLVVFLVMVVMIFIRVLAESYDIPRSIYFLRGDMYGFTMPVIAALLSSLCYSIGKKKSRAA